MPNQNTIVAVVVALAVVFGLFAGFGSLGLIKNQEEQAAFQKPPAKMITYGTDSQGRVTVKAVKKEKE